MLIYALNFSHLRSAAHWPVMPMAWPHPNLVAQVKASQLCICGGTGTDSTVPTNTVQVLITTGTVMDSG